MFEDDNTLQCPRCKMVIPLCDIDHVESCEGMSQRIECIICSKQLAAAYAQRHIESCLRKSDKASMKKEAKPVRGRKSGTMLAVNNTGSTFKLDFSQQLNKEPTLSYKDTDKLMNAAVKLEAKSVPPLSNLYLADKAYTLSLQEKSKPSPNCNGLGQRENSISSSYNAPFKKKIIKDEECESTSLQVAAKCKLKRRVQDEEYRYSPESNRSEQKRRSINDFSSPREVHHLSFSHFSCISDCVFKFNWGSREALENSCHVRGNKQVEGRDCMYGGIYPKAMEKIILEANITSKDTFMDIGSGIGQAVIQVAACTGALSYGIEIDESRYRVSEHLKNMFCDEVKKEGNSILAADVLKRIVLLGNCFTNCLPWIHDASVIYFNNFAGYFNNSRACDSPEKAFFRNMEQKLVDILKAGPKGVRLITLNKLHYAPNGWVQNIRHFQLKKVELGERACSWKDDLDAYLYIVSPTWICKQCTYKHEKYGETEDCCICRTKAMRKRHVE